MFNKKVFEMLKPIKGLKKSDLARISGAMIFGQAMADTKLAISEVLLEDFSKGKITLTDEQWERVNKKIKERRRYFKEQVDKINMSQDNGPEIEIVDLE